MSRRFGRNQKRRLREETEARIALIADASFEKARQYSASLQEKKTLLDQVEEILNDIRITVDKHSAMFPPKDQKDSYRGSTYVREVIEKPLLLSVFDPAGSVANTMRFHNVMMYLLETDAVMDSLSRQLHMVVKLADKRAFYSISGHALMELDEHIIYKHILPQMASSLIASIRREGVRL